MTEFLALPGFYNLLYLHIEPLSTLIPFVMTWLYPGAEWFYNELIPSEIPALPTGRLEPRTTMAIWQLVNCYLLLCMISSFVFRAVRDALPHDSVSQERIIGASFLALAIADLTHIGATFAGLPPHLRYNFAAWNPMTHGNITSVVVLFCGRVAWYLGIGRKRYYFGQKIQKVVKNA